MLSKKINQIRFVTIGGLLVLTLSIAVLIGWFFNIEVLKSILDGYISMKFNTALSFLVLSFCLVASTSIKRISATILLMEMFVAIHALASLCQGILSIDLGVDQLLYPDLVGIEKHEAYPGRMSPITSVLFIVMGASMFCAALFQKLRIYCQYAFHFVTVISFICIIGYFFSVPSLYKFSFLTPIAIHTAISFSILSMSASMLYPEIGFTRIFTVKETGNIIAKRLFLQLFALIIIVTYLRLQFFDHSNFSVDSGSIMGLKPSLALTSIGFILICFCFIYKAANAINTSERKQKMAEQHFRSVIESAPNAFIISNPEGDITLINEQAEKLFGYTKQELVGQSIDILVPKKSRKRHPKNRGSYHELPTARYFGAGRDLYAVKKDGTEFPVEIGLNPLATNTDNVILASVIDITERKRNETIIKDQLQELQIRNKELEQFNYIASHDLQEPIRTVSNFIQVIEEDYGHELKDELKSYLNTINDATGRMSLLVKSLLDFARLGKDRELSYVDCNDMVKEVITDLNRLIKESNAEITYGVMPQVYAYKVELRLVFQNLINNAIKFRKKDVPCEVKIHCHEEKDYYEFWVTDNGIGINPRYFDRIFQIFKSLHKEDEYEGHGIGLAHCYKVVGLHKGKIWVESELGTGSTFKFTISKFIQNG
ncbi:sensor histidine kinase [Flavobacterium beibuense]|uniref:histidine kinase n=1 Tax=Flavobacterium beibuense TaxID=657326 RepID=A0A444W993_9FLAO|nr:PAS domain S-box protein [Flavobacterium beibuense]RYJ42471.1 PAS domain S-box protein [Flavobacterium beibuense]